MFLVLILCIYMIICTAGEDTAIHVTQIPERVVILKGGNVTFHCIIPLAYESSGIEVRWRKQGENEYIQSDADGRKRFTIKNRAGGYFDLLNTTYQDSGNYRCVVLRQGEIRGEGTGSELTVCALPTPLKLNWISERNSSAATTLVCETAAFHPGDLTLLWYKNSVAVTVKADTIKQENSEGLYTASSSIPMTQSEANGNIYICLVSHISLQRPAIAMHAVRKPDQEGHNEHLYIWASGSAVGGIVILVFVFIIVLRCRSTNKQQRNTGSNEESVEANNTLTYSAVDMSSSKRKWTQKSEEETAYAKVKQGATREVLTYASVELSQPGNAAKVKARDKITEYAALQTANPRRVKEDGK